jgi:hypothetical protein
MTRAEELEELRSAHVRRARSSWPTRCRWRSLLLERFSRLERAAFAQREVFGFRLSQIASTVSRSKVARRQLAVWARLHMEGSRPPVRGQPTARDELADRLLDAFTILREANQACRPMDRGAP